jgi:hypothetical protein
MPRQNGDLQESFYFYTGSVIKELREVKTTESRPALNFHQFNTLQFLTITYTGYAVEKYLSN